MLDEKAVLFTANDKPGVRYVIVYVYNKEVKINVFFRIPQMTINDHRTSFGTGL